MLSRNVLKLVSWIVQNSFSGISITFDHITVASDELGRCPHTTKGKKSTKVRNMNTAESVLVAIAGVHQNQQLYAYKLSDTPT